MKTNEWLLLFHDHFLYLDNQCAAGDVVPNTREIRMQVYIPSLHSLSLFSDNLRKSI